MTFRAYVSASTTTFVPGQFNNWGSNSNGAISPGDPSRMTYDNLLGCWIKTYTFKIKDPSDTRRNLGDSVFQYKFNAGGMSTTWFSDPLNPETNPLDNNNSILRLAKLFWFQYYQEESGDQITKIVIGLPHANSDSITSIRLSTAATSSGTLATSEVVSSFDRTTRILSYILPFSILKSSYIRLVGYNNEGDSVVYAKGGHVVPRMLMPFYAKHGVTLPSAASNDSTTFRLRVTGKDFVLFRIAPSGQPVSTATAIVMRKNPSSAGDWWMNLKLQPGVYEYVYEIENGKQIYDPWGRDVGQNGTRFSVGPAGLTADDYVWQTTTYQRPPLDKLVIYELHVGEFGGGFYNKPSSQQGTFADFITLLPHLDSLGVNAIELMPINDYGSIGRSGHSWGYDINSYFALEPAYGTARDFKVLVDSSHARGIAVIIDVVFNHLNETSALWQMQPDESTNPYFKDPNDRRLNEDGLVFFKDMDHWTTETQELVYESLKMWLDVYKVDGFRYDYTQGIGWTTSDTTVGILGWSNRIAREYNNAVYQIAEHLPESPALIFYSGMTSGWHDSFRDEVFKDLIPSQRPPLANFEELVLDLGAYGGNDVPSSPNRYANRTEAVNANVNHDEQSLIYEMTTFQNVSLEEAIKRDKLYATFMFTSLGIPMLWQGMEFSAPRGWRSDGEKLTYRPLEWNLRSSLRGQAHFMYYQALILQRRNNPALFNGELRKLARYDSQRVLAWGFVDSTSGAKVMCLANLSSTQRTLTDVPWLGSGFWYDVIDESRIAIIDTLVSTFILPAYTARIFSNMSNGTLGLPTSVHVDRSLLPNRFVLHHNYPNPFNPATSIRFELPSKGHASLKVYNILGELVGTLEDGELGPGTYERTWSGRTSNGAQLPSGVYFARLQSGSFAAVTKMLLLK